MTSNQAVHNGAPRDLTFGPFRLDLEQQVIHRENGPLRLGSRAREILLTLLERPGKTVGKGELMRRVWPDTVVEEGTLRVHISALRKALRDGKSGIRYVENVTGHGYRFVAPVTQAAAAEPPRNASMTLTRLVGRGAVVSSVAASLRNKHLITLVGPGGVGKTTLAMAVADQVRDSYPDGICLVDLASISEPSLLPGTFASALGLAIVSQDPMPGITSYLGSKRILVLLDSCEHLIEHVVLFTDQLLSRAPVDIIATSREPLRGKNEWVMRLAPLELPPSSAALTAREALGFSAIQMFVERAMASLDDFELTDADVPAVVDICRRLDGLPLAIELAAARVELFGLRDLAARLDDRLGLLTRGRRTAAARHQTLRATLDWSYDILPPAEQTALCRLAVFSGPFDLPSARQALVGGEIAESAALDLLTNLAAKSLLSVHTTGQQVLYRLLDTSRAYALEKLDASQESSEIRRRHAVLCCAKAQTGPDWERRSSPDALVGQGLEEVRAALRWCFSPKGDPSLGVSLTAASAPSWFQSPFLGEYRKHIQHALAVLPRTPESNFALELQLNAALGDAMLYTVGPNPSITVAFTRTLELAEQLGITVHRRRALSGLCIGRIAAGDYHSAVGFAQALHLCVEDSPDQTSPASRDWLVALAHHLCGQQLHARQHIERALSRPLDSTARWSDRPFHFAPRVASHGILARILWIQGFPEQAACSARRSLAYAQGADHPLSLCYALSVCAAMALYAGETQQVGRLLARLLHLANRHCLSEWLYWARCLELALAHCQGGSTGGAPGMPDPLHCCWHQEILATFHPQLATAATLLRAESGLSGWATAELLRIRAEQLLAQPAQDTLTAETVLWEAIESARNQGALAWELRAATSLASLWRQQGRVHEARDLLLSVYCKFQEGFATADLVRAKALLEQLPLRSSSPILTHSPACALNRS